MTTTKSKAILAQLAPHKTNVALGLFFLILTNVCDKAIPWLLQHAIDALRGAHFDEVKRYALWVVSLAVAMVFVRTASRVLVFNASRDIEHDLRMDVLHSLHRLGPSFLSRMATGEIMSRAINDLTQVRLLLGFGLLNIVNSAIAYVAGIALMFSISPKLTLYALIPYPVFIWVARAFSRAMFQRSAEAQKSLGALTERAQESFAGMRLVRALGLDAVIRARFDVANENAVKRNMALVTIRGLMWPVLMLLSSSGTLIVLWQGGQMVLHNEISVGAFAAFNFYLAQLLWPTLALGYILSIVQRGRASYTRVRELLDAEPDIVEAEGAIEAKQTGALRVEDLNFSYGDRKILEDVSASVSAGSKLAIVGRTGSGKSTFASLLPRLLKTPKDAVFLDGDDITKLSLRSLRKTIGYAPQESFLFSTTVARNIGYSLDDPDSAEAHERIRKVAREACVLDEIEGMADGFDTVVGERGVQLSGGQKQRIALARALLREPAVLVLDDPLSAVDAKTEARILEALARAGENRTLVLVTNRIAASKDANQILVFDKGRIVERGTHDDLVRAGGLYTELASKQRLEEELASL